MAASAVDDMRVVSCLKSYGFLNHIMAKMSADVGQVVRDGGVDAMRPYKTVRRNEDNTVARSLVLKYLQKHNLVETIGCIQIESEQLFRNVLESEDISESLGVSERNIDIAFINGVCGPDVIMSNRRRLRAGIRERLALKKIPQHTRNEPKKVKRSDSADTEMSEQGDTSGYYDNTRNEEEGGGNGSGQSGHPVYSEGDLSTCDADGTTEAMYDSIQASRGIGELLRSSARSGRVNPIGLRQSPDGQPNRKTAQSMRKESMDRAPSGLPRQSNSSTGRNESGTTASAWSSSGIDDLNFDE